VWVEAQTQLCERLRHQIDGQIPCEVIIDALIYDVQNETKALNIYSNSQSSSILSFGTHQNLYPDIVIVDKVIKQTKRLDFVLDSIDCSTAYDFLNLDIQGVELNALRSLGSYISNLKWIYTEVNFEMVYLDAPLIEEIDTFLKKYNFRRILTKKSKRGGLGDAFYVKNPSKLNLIRAFEFKCYSYLENFGRAVFSAGQKIRYLTNSHIPR
jgi:hypothetical protein